jgi:hypothetical protein
MGYDMIMYIFYDSVLNIFYDINGLEVHYLFELLTPNDIMLFKQDHEHNIFMNREDRRTMIEILVDYEME